jgi:hypothetical protein
MTTDTRSVREGNLLPGQRAFLERLRQQDQHVVVVRDSGMLVFQGPVIGEGRIPHFDETPESVARSRPLYAGEIPM